MSAEAKTTDEDSNSCIVCFSADDVKHRCKSCKTYTCNACWYSQCRKNCPICDRKALNEKHMCNECSQQYLIKDVVSCAFCRNGVCLRCMKMKKHDCCGLVWDVQEYDDVDKLLEQYSRFDNQSNCFRVIGKVKTQYGVMYVTKEMDCTGSVMMLALDVEHLERSLHTFCIANAVLILKSCSMYRAIKCFSTDNNNIDTIKQFLISCISCI